MIKSVLCPLVLKNDVTLLQTLFIFCLFVFCFFCFLFFCCCCCCFLFVCFLVCLLLLLFFLLLFFLSFFFFFFFLFLVCFFCLFVFVCCFFCSGIPSQVIGACIMMQYTDNETLIWWVWQIQKHLLNLFCIVYTMNKLLYLTYTRTCMCRRKHLHRTTAQLQLTTGGGARYRNRKERSDT